MDDEASQPSCKLCKFGLKAIDTKILADENKEKEDETVTGVANAVEGDGTIVGGVMDEAPMDMGHIEEVVSAL